MSISPALDTVSIGDTLWLQSIIPEFLKDQISGEDIQVSNFDFNVKMTINRMDIIGTPDAEKEFTYINLKGSIDVVPLSSVILASVHYEYSGINNELIAGIVPEEKGLYQIVFYNLREDLTNVSVSSGNCSESIVVEYEMNGNSTDNNYNLLLNSPGPIATFESFKHDGGYAFVVK
jgi:hypothetical protein